MMTRPPPEKPRAAEAASSRDGAQGWGLLRGDYTADDCRHERHVLVRLDCRGGGVQFRRACLSCRRLGNALPHAVAHAEIARSGIEAPLADLDVVHAAQRAYWERSGLLI